jgi:peroxiredoxin
MIKILFPSLRKAAVLAMLISIVTFLQSFIMHKDPLIGSTIQDFSLQNVDGQKVGLSNYPDAKGFIVVFTCNHCPFAKLYTDRLNELQQKYEKLGIPLLAINSMDSIVYGEESFAKMQKRAKAEKFKFPYLQDGEQTVGKNFEADHTPHAYVIWKVNNQWTIQYSGAIDDNGEDPQKANPYIENAVNSLLKNEKVAEPNTPSVGCKIFYRK